MNAQFSFCGLKKPFCCEIFLRGIQRCFPYDRGEQNFPRQRSFCRLFGYIFLYGQENYFSKLREFVYV